jgi:hypothetical protein
MILDGKQDEAFLVLYKKRFLFFFNFRMFLVLFGGFVNGVFLASWEGGVFFSSTSTRKFLFESRDREVDFFADVHF